MGLDWMFWRQRDTPASVGAQDLAAGASAQGYVEWLVGYMLKRSLTELTIAAATPLPVDADAGGESSAAPLLAHQTVINRLKVMSGLNPVRFAQPREGRFTRPRGDHAVIVHVRFDDRPTPPVCTLRLEIRRRVA